MNVTIQMHSIFLNMELRNRMIYVFPPLTTLSETLKAAIIIVLDITPSPGAYGHVVSLTNGILEALGSHKRGVYPNFIKGSATQKRFTEIFSLEIYDRLKALKAHHDPQNAFAVYSNFSRSVFCCRENGQYTME